MAARTERTWWMVPRSLSTTDSRACVASCVEDVSRVGVETTGAPHGDAQYLRELLPYAQQSFLDLPNERLLERSRNEVQ